MRKVSFWNEEPQPQHETHRDWLKEIGWTAYALLGFRHLEAQIARSERDTQRYVPPTSPQKAEYAFDIWIAAMKAKEGHKGIEFLRVRDNWNWRSNPHFHVLIATSKPMTMSNWEDKWHELAGFGWVKPYDPDRGICNYLARKWVSGAAEVDFSDGFKELLS